MTDAESLDTPLPLEAISTRLSRCSSIGTQMRRERTLGQASNIIRTISNRDAESRYRVEEADNRIPPSGRSPCHSIHDTTEKKLISWEPMDPDNPYNWSNVCISSTIVRPSLKLTLSQKRKFMLCALTSMQPPKSFLHA